MKKKGKKGKKTKTNPNQRSGVQGLSMTNSQDKHAELT
jgi:hypothetical protein